MRNFISIQIRVMRQIVTGVRYSVRLAQAPSRVRELHYQRLVTIKNANGTLDVFERIFDGEPWGYGRSRYRRVEFDMIVEPEPMAAGMAVILALLAAALAPVAAGVLLASWIPMGIA